jgi:hypothetical protein
MQADRTVKREPIGGSLTNFTGGTKTIALIAAAEWFEKVEAGSGGGGAAATAVAASKAALASAASGQGPTLLTQSGCEGLFLFDSSNLSAMVSADGLQAIYVAPASDPTGASGAWVRVGREIIDIFWFMSAAEVADVRWLQQRLEL